MAGNVAEWTSDWYGEVDAEAAIDPTGPKSGTRRVLRGGGWIDSAKYCRSAFRTSAEPTSRDCNVGFRVILTR
jgi:formylglycine-generating enzyme required for sulfatase activity